MGENLKSLGWRKTKIDGYTKKVIYKFVTIQALSQHFRGVVYRIGLTKKVIAEGGIGYIGEGNLDLTSDESCGKEKRKRKEKWNCVEKYFAIGVHVERYELGIGQ